MIEEMKLTFKEQSTLASIEEMVIDCQDLKNSLSIINEMNFDLEEIEALNKKDMLQKISEQRTIIKSTQAINEMMMKKLLHLNEKLMKEQQQ